MKYGYKIFITISKSTLCELCNNQNWYTLGDEEDFNNVLVKLLNNKLTIDDVISIAVDIIAHSNGMSFEDVTVVCDLILQKSHFAMVFDTDSADKITNEVIRQEVAMLTKVNQRLRGDKI